MRPHAGWADEPGGEGLTERSIPAKVRVWRQRAAHLVRCLRPARRPACMQQLWPGSWPGGAPAARTRLVLPRAPRPARRGPSGSCTGPPRSAAACQQACGHRAGRTRSRTPCRRCEAGLPSFALPPAQPQALCVWLARPQRCQSLSAGLTGAALSLSSGPQSITGSEENAVCELDSCCWGEAFVPSVTAVVVPSTVMGPLQACSADSRGPGLHEEQWLGYAAGCSAGRSAPRACSRASAAPAVAQPCVRPHSGLQRSGQAADGHIRLSPARPCLMIPARGCAACQALQCVQGHPALQSGRLDAFRLHPSARPGVVMQVKPCSPGAAAAQQAGIKLWCWTGPPSLRSGAGSRVLPRLLPRRAAVRRGEFCGRTRGGAAEELLKRVGAGAAVCASGQPAGSRPQRVASQLGEVLRQLATSTSARAAAWSRAWCGPPRAPTTFLTWDWCRPGHSSSCHRST